MALSDCIKCWCTPCECGYKYREMSIENKINQIKAIMGEDKNKIITKLNQDDTEKEILNKIFEFETYCTSRFDSEARVAMAVYDYVKQMKLEFNTKDNG